MNGVGGWLIVSYVVLCLFLRAPFWNAQLTASHAPVFISGTHS